MTQLDISKTQYSSIFPGFGNYKTLSSSGVIAGQTLTYGQTVSTTITSLVNTSTDLYQVQVQLSGLDSNWYVLSGYMNITYTTGLIRRPLGSSDRLSVVMYTTTNAGQLSLYVLLTAATVSASITIPTININVTEQLFSTPFN